MILDAFDAQTTGLFNASKIMRKILKTHKVIPKKPRRELLIMTHTLLREALFTSESVKLNCVTELESRSSVFGG